MIAGLPLKPATGFCPPSLICCGCSLRLDCGMPCLTGLEREEPEVRLKLTELWSCSTEPPLNEPFSMPCTLCSCRLSCCVVASQKASVRCFAQSPASLNITIEEVPLHHAQDVHHFQLIHEQPAQHIAILVTLLSMVVLGFDLTDATPKCCHHLIPHHDAVHALSLQLSGQSCDPSCSMELPLSSPA